MVCTFSGYPTTHLIQRPPLDIYIATLLNFTTCHHCRRSAVDSLGSSTTIKVQNLTAGSDVCSENLGKSGSRNSRIPSQNFPKTASEVLLMSKGSCTLRSSCFGRRIRSVKIRASRVFTPLRCPQDTELSNSLVVPIEILSVAKHGKQISSESKAIVTLIGLDLPSQLVTVGKWKFLSGSPTKNVYNFLVMTIRFIWAHRQTKAPEPNTTESQNEEGLKSTKTPKGQTKLSCT